MKKLILAFLILTAGSAFGQCAADYVYNPFTHKLDCPGSTSSITFASEAEAKAGTNTTNSMNSLRTAQAISAAIGGDVTRTSATVLSVAAGSCSVNGKPIAWGAFTSTLSGTGDIGHVYGGVDGSGYHVWHNENFTLTNSAATNVLAVEPGVSAIPDGTPCPQFDITISSNNTWPTLDPATMNLRTVQGGPQYAASSTIAPTYNVDNTVSFDVIGSSAVSVYNWTPYPTQNSSANETTAFSANETRWLLIPVLAPISFTKVLIPASTALGASKGLRIAIANTSGTILYKSAVGVAADCTGSSYTLCALTFSPAVSLSAGSSYCGVTTDSTTFKTWISPNFGYTSLGEIMRQGTAPAIAGTGTAGSGTNTSVDFGASMGTLTPFNNVTGLDKVINCVFSN